MKYLSFLLVLVANLPGAELGNKVPDSQPAARVNLMTSAGADMVHAQWRYSDTKIVEVDFTGPGADGQPTGKPVKTYDYLPHAGGAAFDDSGWEQISPESLDQRRSTGRLCFNWYRTSITLPEKIGDFSTLGSTVVFETSVDDYAEVWVDGELTRAFGQTGQFCRGGLERIEPADYRPRCKTGAEDSARHFRRQWTNVESAD